MKEQCPLCIKIVFTTFMYLNCSLASPYKMWMWIKSLQQTLPCSNACVWHMSAASLWVSVVLEKTVRERVSQFTGIEDGWTADYRNKTRQLTVDSFKGLWLIEVATCHIWYTFLSLCQIFSQENGQNTKILKVSHFHMIRKWLPPITRCATH